MRPQYSITQRPASEPITYDQAASHLRVDSSDDMECVTELISVAREYVDNATGRASLRTSYKLTAASWCSLFPESHGIAPLYRTPLVSVESVKYYPPDSDTLTTMSADDYRVIAIGEPGCVQFTESLPSVEDRPDAIQIAFTAGNNNINNVSPSHKHAIKRVVADLYESRYDKEKSGAFSITSDTSDLINSQKVGGWFE
jgi:uncharacterized phiE125 gp8 family phage protein